MPKKIKRREIIYELEVILEQGILPKGAAYTGRAADEADKKLEKIITMLKCKKGE